MPRHGNLLCIDDDPACLKVRKMLLENFGYEVSTSNSGRDGLSLFKSRRFDAVLLDYQMPGMDGGQVASEMRRLKPHVPIIMLSAYSALPDSVTRVVNAFVNKTEPTAYLLRQVDRLVATSGGDSAWLLAAALGTTALLGFAVQSLVRPRRPAAEPSPGPAPKTA